MTNEDVTTCNHRQVIAATVPTKKTIISPNGTAFGGASKEQATQLAQMFAEHHNMAMKQKAEMQQSIIMQHRRNQR